MSAPHAAMLMIGGAIDPLFNLVRNLTTFDGTNGSTTFPNLATTSAGPAFAVSAGSPALSNAFVEYPAVQATSLACLGQDQLVDTGTSANYQTGTGDFTFEWSMYFVSTAGANTVVFAFAPAAGNRIRKLIFAPVGGLTRDQILNFAFSTLDSGASNVSVNAWHKFAVCRSGTQGRLFIDGALMDTETWTGLDINVDHKINFGARTGNSAANIYVANFRFTLAARYTAAYTPATAPFPTM